MRIQLDTGAKTIKLESDVLISVLIETLEKLFPKGEWKKFKLETNVIISNWNTPIIIEREVIKEKPWNPYTQPYYHYFGTTSRNWQLCNSGIFNLQVE